MTYIAYFLKRTPAANRVFNRARSQVPPPPSSLFFSFLPDRKSEMTLVFVKLPRHLPKKATSRHILRNFFGPFRDPRRFFQFFRSEASLTQGVREILSTLSFEISFFFFRAYFVKSFPFFCTLLLPLLIIHDSLSLC